MITSDYLMRVLPELEEFNSKEISGRVLEADGFDGVIALLSNIRDVEFPCVVIEDRSMGNITTDTGPLDSYSIPLWVMVHKDHTQSNTELFIQSFELVKKILKILIRDANTILDGFDYSRISYNKRFATDACGYEILLTFRQNIDLSL